MIDVLYVAATIGFFGLMLAYTRGCERLGGGAVSSDEPTRGRTEP